MSASRVKRINTSGGDHYGYAFRCLGCKDEHVIPTAGPKAWGFNNNVELPTFTPSILVYETKRTDGTVFSPRCHSFVRDGRIEYLADCGHALAGQTVDLPEYTEAP